MTRSNAHLMGGSHVKFGVQLLNLVCIVLRGRPAYVVANSIAVHMYKREVLNLVSNAMTRESDGVYRVGTAVAYMY